MHLINFVRNPISLDPRSQSEFLTLPMQMNRRQVELIQGRLNGQRVILANENLSQSLKLTNQLGDKSFKWKPQINLYISIA